MVESPSLITHMAGSALTDQTARNKTRVTDIFFLLFILIVLVILVLPPR
jgi:predicted nucleic acid-binding Zn ribbon protein